MVITVSDDAASTLADHPAGTTFVFAEGTHRLVTLEPRDGDTFLGRSGAILSGAIELNGAELVDQLWVYDQQTQEGETRGECQDGYEGCIFPEQLFLDGEPLWQVTSLSEVEPGKWFFDYAADRIYLADDPTGRHVETSVSRFAFFGSAHDVTIRGLVIEKYANPAQRGAIHGKADPGALSTGWMIEENVIRLNHGAGIRLGREMVVRGNLVHHNGHLGMSGTGTGILVEDNEIAYNQTAGFQSFGWVGGGAKFIDTEDLRVIGNHVHHNDGHGLHTDHNNVNTLYEGNFVTDNSGVGISHEISYSATIRDNVIERNGFGRPQGVAGAGIMINTSSDVQVIGNTLRDNADGIAGQHQDRGSGGEFGPWRLSNLLVEGNLVVLNEGETGVIAGVDSEAVFDDWNNRFVDNTYELGSSVRFLWDGASVDFPGWQEFGQDTAGSVEFAAGS